MATTRNNMLFYYANITTIGGVNSVFGAVGICSKFSAMVVKPHTSTALSDLKKVILSLKAINPSFKVFGYTDLGGAADMDAWTAQLTQWQTDLPTGYLDGIYLDKFGYEFTNATRANQNTAIAACHTALLSAFVNPTSLVDALGKLPTEVEPVIGRTATIRDWVNLPDFFYVNANSSSLTLESKESLNGRLKYANGAKTKTGGLYNFGVVGAVGAGTATQILQEAYDNVVVMASDYHLDFLAVVPYDVGATANKYFYKNKSNTFAD